MFLKRLNEKCRTKSSSLTFGRLMAPTIFTFFSLFLAVIMCAEAQFGSLIFAILGLITSIYVLLTRSKEKAHIWDCLILIILDILLILNQFA